ncbi:MAG: cysteine desulfurase [Akkermansia sp.]|nr:cysteine desulfurase [Akkermansia sp.]
MIYWDNNATTPIAPEVLEAMLPFLREQYFNPSAAYHAAKSVRRAIDQAREQVAALVGAEPDEIIFTSGGTEATNTALAQFSTALTLATEHPATLRTIRGTACPVLSNGVVDLPEWKEHVQNCDGASFAWANHETGVLQPIKSMCAAAEDTGARVHVDVVQAAGKMPIHLHEYPIHFASLSAHKLHGPKGVGALYVRRGTEWRPTHTGGAQEDYRRAGTENVPGIIGFGKAAELARAAAETYAGLAELRTRFLARLQDAGIDYVVNGASANRLPHVLNMRVPGCSAESLFLLLEPAGLLCSAGSACTSAEPHPSHVLKAMGLADKEIRESLRFSMSRYTSAEEVDAAADIFVRVVQKLRSVQSASTGPVMVYR